MSAFELTYRKYCLHNSLYDLGKEMLGSPGACAGCAGRAAPSPGDCDGGGSHQGALFLLETTNRGSVSTLHQEQGEELISSLGLIIVNLLCSSEF